ncbi:MAG: flagellar hook-length control protein FliK [Spirochaetaceae bacterium]|nr:flagellar hook-length control protein FliK [Spirochaetaceae bacterium]
MRAKKRTPAIAHKSAAGTEKTVKKTANPVLHTDKLVKAKNDEISNNTDNTEMLVAAATASQPVLQTLSEVKNKQKDGANLRLEPAMQKDTAQEQEPVVLKDAALRDKAKASTVIAKTIPLTEGMTADNDEKLKNRVIPKKGDSIPQAQEPVKKPEKSPRISVRDLRGEIISENARHNTDTVSLHQSQQTATATVQSDLVLDLRFHAPSPTVGNNATEFIEAHQFENLIAQELQDNLSGDIVRQAQVVLRNADSGSIRLSLKPESLGTIKVHLEMVENKLIGHIVVESAEVLRAFEREVHSLEQAFRDSGFQTAHLDTRLAGGNQNGAGSGQDHNTGQFFSERLAAAYDSVEPELSSITGEQMREMQQINVLV